MMAAGSTVTDRQLLEAVVNEQDRIKKLLLNTRVRKSIDYTRSYRPELRSPFEGGDIIAVEPFDKFGIYEIRRDVAPIVVSPQKIHLTSDFTQTLSPRTATVGKITSQVTALDVNLNEIAIYKIMPEDYGYRFEYSQPATLTKFGNKAGPWGVYGADMQKLYDNPHYQGMIHEMMVFADKTPITITAYSTDPNVSNSYIRARVYGYQYAVTELPKNSLQNNDPRIVASIWVGTPQK